MSDREALLMNQEQDDEDEGLGFGEEGSADKDRLRHPFVAFFLIFFRVAAVLVYILSGIFTSSFVMTYAVVVIFLALDFWNCKNIAGRIMVGLRWWNYVDDEGQSHWVFESRKGVRAGGRPREKRIFWGALIISPIVWALLFFTSFVTFRLQWSILVILALLLNGANLYGYVRCKLGHQPGIADATGILGQGLSTMLLRRATAGAGGDADSGSHAFTQQV